MDHLPVPPDCKHSIIAVPYLGVAPVYDHLGFHGFPARIGVDPVSLTGISLEDLSRYLWPIVATPRLRDIGADEPGVVAYCLRWTESFFQEWLWFGLLHEFERACSVPIPWAQLTHYDQNSRLRRISTDWMTLYAKEVSIRLYCNKIFQNNLKEGDLCYIYEHKRAYDHDLYEQHLLCKARALSFDFPEPVGYELGPFKVMEQTGPETFRLQDLDFEVIEVMKQNIASPCSDQIHALAHEEFEAFDVPAMPLALGKEQCSEFWNGSDTRPAATRALEMARYYYDQFFRYNEGHISIDIVLAFDIIGESIERLLKLLFNQRRTSRPLWLQQYLETRMVRNNWCRRRTSKMFMGASTTFQYLACLMPSYDDKMHLCCTEKVCFNNELRLLPRSESQHAVDLETSLVHDSSTCEGNCEAVQISEKILIDIISTGDFPAIQRTGTSHEGYQFEARAVSKQPFVAISHVWAHGLGNRGKNELPRCQVESLFNKIEKLLIEGQPLLWIDTLAVPIELEFKLLGIAKMREIYSTASAVLVVDKFLQQVGVDTREQRMQVLCSEWQRRLWTLQEGRLTSNLWFQFREGAVSIKELLDLPKGCSRQPYVDLFQDSEEYARDELDWHFRLHQDRAQLTADVIQDMVHRKATDPTDEPICIAVILGLELEQYGGRPTMQDIYRDLQELPRNLPFLPAAKFKEPGLRWAPTTLLNQGYQTFLGVTDRPERRASASEAGFLMASDLFAISDCLTIQKSSELETGIQLMYICIDGQPGYILELDKSHILESSVIPRPMVLLEKRFVEWDGTSRGILASISDKPAGISDLVTSATKGKIDIASGEDILYCHHIYPLRVSSVDEHTLVRISWLARTGLSASIVSLEAKLEEQRYICLD